MARLSNSAVMVISESKLDKSISNSEILKDNYDVLRCVKSINGGGVPAILETT